MGSGREFGAKKPKPSNCGSVSGVLSQTATRVDGVGQEWGAGLRWVRWWRWWAASLAHAKREMGLGAKKVETERAGSVLAMPRPTTKEGDGKRWWERVDKEVVMGSHFVCTREAGDRFGS